MNEEEWVRDKNMINHDIEENPAICNKMHEARSHYAKWNKVDRKRQTLYDVIYIQNIYKEKVELVETEREWWLPWPGVEEVGRC